MTMDDLFGDSGAASDLDRSAAAGAGATPSAEPLVSSHRAPGRNPDIAA